MSLTPRMKEHLSELFRIAQMLEDERSRALPVGSDTWRTLHDASRGVERCAERIDADLRSMAQSEKKEAPDAD